MSSQNDEARNATALRPGLVVFLLNYFLTQIN